jgi:hypothetical protein
MAVAICISGQTFINAAGAVIVNPIAYFGGAGIHIGVGVIAVSLYFAVSVTVVVHAVARQILTIAILIYLITAHLLSAGINTVAGIVTIICRFGARPKRVMTVAVCIGGQALVNDVVAVVVDAVACFHGVRVDIGIGVVTVSLYFAVSVTVVVHIIHRQFRGSATGQGRCRLIAEEIIGCYAITVLDPRIKIVVFVG